MKLQGIVTLAAVGLATVIGAMPASAATYLFNVTGSYNASFMVNSSPRPDYSLNNAAFVLYDVAGIYGGVSSIADVTFYKSTQAGGLKIHNFANDLDLLVTHGAQLYTGTEAAPTFRLGTFSLTPSAGLDRYTLTITDAAAGAVPEPASWAMMILGMGAVGGALRRRSKVSTTVKFA